MFVRGSVGGGDSGKTAERARPLGGQTRRRLVEVVMEGCDLHPQSFQPLSLLARVRNLRLKSRERYLTQRKRRVIRPDAHNLVPIREHGLNRVSTRPSPSSSQRHKGCEVLAKPRRGRRSCKASRRKLGRELTKISRAATQC